MSKFDYTAYIFIDIAGQFGLHVAAVFEQIAMTPEGRELIVQAAERSLGKSFWTEGDTNGVEADTLSVTLNAESLAKLRFPNANGEMTEASLQAVILEELFHAADPDADLGNLNTTIQNIQEFYASGDISDELKADIERLVDDARNGDMPLGEFLVSLQELTGESFVPQTELNAAAFVRDFMYRRYAAEGPSDDYFARDFDGEPGYHFYPYIYATDEERASIAQYGPDSAMNLANALLAAEADGACRNFRQCVRKSNRNEDFLAPYTPGEIPGAEVNQR